MNYRNTLDTTSADLMKQMLYSMQEQTKLCKEMYDKVKSMPSIEGNGGTKEKNGRLHFTKKEIVTMPRLKDFHVRLKNGKYYEIRFRKYGYNVSFSSKDFNEAKQKAFAWLRTFENEIHANYRFLVLSKPETEADMFNEQSLFKPFADLYMETIKRKSVKENTFRDLKATYNRHIAEKYGDMPMYMIRPAFIQSHLNALHETTPRLCETVKTLLNGILEYAVNNGVIQRNPVKAVYIQKYERKNGSALTPQEEAEFIKNIENNPHKTVYLKMLYSGVRPCEVNEITEDITANTLTIKNGKLKSYQKNYFRTIPIFPKYKQVVGIECKRINTGKLSNEFHTICPNHTLKDLRHTFTTRARECGIDNEVVAVWTGHSLGNITSSVYTHFSMEFMQKQAEKLIY